MPSCRRWPTWPSGSRSGAGEVLAREGRIGREFFLILTGSVAVTQKGRRVNTLGAGDFFGELAAMDPGPRNATVTALSDLDVLIIGPREFSAMADIPGFRDAPVPQHGEPVADRGGPPGGRARRRRTVPGTGGRRLPGCELRQFGSTRVPRRPQTGAPSAYPDDAGHSSPPTGERR